MDQHGLTQEQLGTRIGKSQDTVSNALTIIEKIPQDIRDEFYETSRKVSAAVLLEIARADTVHQRRRMWERVKEGHYTVRQAREERGSRGGESGEEHDRQRPRREVIRLDNATVIVQCQISASGDEIVNFLQEATKVWQQRLALHTLRIRQ
jgi:ParB-like chromosome segregation protein Spo0J